ncbi:hypothetical protein FIBSPDRAFT_875164 [Athelia psychrophila]|uniref:20S-pre-rRNA D-site endonuclease NOB1 n=1 Tax=Athelia psychrophila TaxID=1759441 RepID=A0A165WLN7_9AGAM|nr:hypothetical protein FIBSPDRAFT_875164 [Fibularhizoctonia sp. CBS 109695]
MALTDPPRCRNLVLDAGPLLSLSPLRNLAATYLTVPQVLDELKDKRAREHFEKLGLSAGVKIEVRSPSAVALTYVIQFAKKTGDYAVLSHADLSVLALTYDLHLQAQADAEKKLKESPEPAPASEEPIPAHPEETDVDVQKITEDVQNATLSDSDATPADPTDQGSAIATAEDGPVADDATAAEEPHPEPLDVEAHQEPSHPPQPSPTPPTEPEPAADDAPLYDDPSDSEDGDGEWITPSNVALHKSRALDMLPSADASRRTKDEEVFVGCMTADFAMQNVLLQMGLSLVGVEGKRIQKVKTWVLRCHACFKLCKDNSKKFCPSCGNPTLLRVSVTIAAPGAAANVPKNFQYKTRGTKYSIPAPKAGSAKHGPGEGLILREDQLQYMRARKLADGKKEREEAKLVKGVMAKGLDSGGGRAMAGSWMDPDWMPEIMSENGKGRTARPGLDGDMPAIGYGRKNPNAAKRRTGK